MDIVSKILDELIKLFGKDVIVYRENVKAGFKENSFFIPAVNAKSRGQLNDTNNIVLNCQIIYFPRLNKINDDIQDRMDKLLINFTSVGKRSVFNRDFNVSDDCLIFTFDLTVLTQPSSTGKSLKNIEVKGRGINDRKR